MKSITDKPISTIDDDLLKLNTYCQALANFIISSDTPITIGLQGEWGTGKTSLMGILLEKLEKNDIATSWVNTWEYSLFSNSTETTPKVLYGMLNQLENSCKLQGNWDIGDEASKKIKSTGRFLANISNQIVKKQIGIDIISATDNNDVISAISEIASIKKEISSVINKLITSNKNPYKKVVFFIDDLDRINPASAVEILEALKNIFDIPFCVFVLAIDYDIVVKGLESKFGPKTESNEREFRSFFDKIIQVPFSMPVGIYDIEMFLTEKLKCVGIKIDDSMSESYAKIVRLTIGTNPRSLKRFINSFSLINNIRSLQMDECDDDESNDLMVFCLLGIQISYPQIFRLISQEPDYLNWSKAFGSKHALNWEQIQEKLTLYDEHDLLNEEWEQVVWGFCQREPYLKARSFDVLNLLNFLRTSFPDNLNHELVKALEFASITSVEDDADTRQAITKANSKTYFGSLEEKCKQLIENGISPEGVESFRRFCSPLAAAAKESQNYKINFAKTGGSFRDNSKEKKKRMLAYYGNPQKRKPGLGFWVSVYQDHFLSHLSQLLNGGKSDNYFIHSDNHLEFRARLIDDLGVEKYHSFLEYVSSYISKKP